MSASVAGTRSPAGCEAPVALAICHRSILRHKLPVKSYLKLTGKMTAIAKKERQGRLPDFIVIGAAKAGTTSLDLYLGLHPEIHMAKPKEPRFFVDSPLPAGRWSLGVEWYKKQFVTKKIFCGEASPQYARSPSVPGVAERMAKIVPRAKIIYLVREPFSRIRSNYLMHVKHGVFYGTFEEYVENHQLGVDSSCYGTQLQEYLRYYPLEQILVIQTEDLKVDRRGTLSTIFKFIGADESFFTPLFLHQRRVGKSEVYPSRTGRKISHSTPMKFAERILHGGIYYHLQNTILRLFSQPPPASSLPDFKQQELMILFRKEVRLLRKLSGLPLLSLGPD